MGRQIGVPSGTPTAADVAKGWCRPEQITLEKYAYIMEMVDRWKTRLGPVEHLRLCEIALGYLPAVIQQCGGSVYCTAIYPLSKYYPAMLDCAAVIRFCEFIYSEPALESFRFLAEQAVKDLEYASAILDEVKVRPGISQFAVRKKLDIPKEAMTSVLKYMEAFGRIRRVPTERTNRLYPVEQNVSRGASA